MLIENAFARCRTLVAEEIPGACEALRMIEETLKIGAWNWDMATGAHCWTPGLYRLLDIDPKRSDPSLELFESVVHPADAQLALEFRKALNEGIPFVRQFRILRRNGGVRWVHSHADFIFDRTGKLASAAGVVQDITEQHEALQVEQVWKDRYHALVKATAAIVWSAGADLSRIGYENLADIMGPGEDPSLFLGDGWKNRIHPNDRDEALAACNRGIQAGAPFQFEYRVHLPNDSYRWYSTHAAPIKNPDASVRGWIGVCTDIHERRVWSRENNALALTGPQIRSARGLLNWSVRDLADISGISPAVIRRLEERDDAPNEPEPAIEKLRAAFEKAGVEFLFPAVGKPGIRPA